MHLAIAVTAALLALGCHLCRTCQSGKCNWGIATQRPELRKNFCGKPDYVVNFMAFVAQELRMIMANGAACAARWQVIHMRRYCCLQWG